MPRRAPLAVALALLAAALAGCTSAPPQAAEAPGEQEQPPEARLLTPQEVANATAQEQADQAQGEFARALEERFHTHNYWGGQLEKILMDADVSSGPLVPFDGNNPLFSAFFAAFRLGFGGAGFTPFEMPEGSIIPPETERVEVTVTWADSPTITGLQLLYMSAMSKDLEAAEPFAANGGTAIIPTNLTMNDMPHTTVSKWRWFLAADNPNGGPGVFNGTAHVTIKAFRNNTLFLAPPHPDWWGDDTTLTLMEANGTLSCTRAVVPVFLGVDALPVNCDEGFAFLELPNGTIVPPHTGLLHLELTWANGAATPDPFATRPDLAYVPANTRRAFPPENQQVESGRAVYQVPVDPRMVDSPYANASEWAFVLFLRSAAPTDNGFFGGVGAFDGEYTLRVTAERETMA